MKEINVEEIMAEIRQEIKDKGYTPDMLSFRDPNAAVEEYCEFDHDEFRDTIGFLEATKYVPWKNPTGHGLKGFVKKVILKLVGPLIAPISDGQNTYNHQVTAAFTQLLGYVNQQNKQLEAYSKEIEELKKRLEKTEK